MTTASALQKSFTERDVRDEWIVGVLSDLELSPTARMVGAYLGLAVDLDDWPSIPLSGIGGLSTLGLPAAIITKACNALEARGWLFIRTRCGRLHRFDLTDCLRREGGRS